MKNCSYSGFECENNVYFFVPLLIKRRVIVLQKL